jgi:hypothetical protein
MKKLLPILALLFLFGCSKDDEVEVTTYHIVNSVETMDGSVEYLDGTMYEVIVFCFKGEDIVREDVLDPISSGGGISKEVELIPDIEKIKISFKFLPKESAFYDLSSNNRKYTLTTFLIEKGKDNEFIINGSTMTQGTLKSASLKSALSVSSILKK